MGAKEESPLDAAERHARESHRLEEETKRRWEAEEAAAARVAAQSASELVGRCLDRLARAGWPKGEEIAVQRYVSERTGLLGGRLESRWRLVDHEVWVAPMGVGYKTGTPIGSMLNGEWARLYRDSQLAIDRDGAIWHGAFHAEKSTRIWRELDSPSNETQVDALTEALGAILAEYVPA